MRACPGGVVGSDTPTCCTADGPAGMDPRKQAYGSILGLVFRAIGRFLQMRCYPIDEQDVSEVRPLILLTLRLTGRGNRLRVTRTVQPIVGRFLFSGEYVS